MSPDKKGICKKQTVREGESVTKGKLKGFPISKRSCMRKLRKSTKRCIVTGILCSFVAGSIGMGFYVVSLEQIKKEYGRTSAITQERLQNNLRQVYVARSNLKAGEPLTEENMEQISVLSEEAQDIFITHNEIGKLLKIDIEEGTYLVKNMVTDFIQKDLREEEFQVFHLNSNLKESDFVDIRIFYPNGENFIVLSKKSIKSISLEHSNCFLWLDAKETHLISSAIVDTYLTEGTKLYTTKYIEPSLQDESKVTYIPNQEVIELINKDPNVIEEAKDFLRLQVREELENKFLTFHEVYEEEVGYQKGTLDKKVRNKAVIGKEVVNNEGADANIINKKLTDKNVADISDEEVLDGTDIEQEELFYVD